MYESLRRHGVEFQDDYIKWCISNEAHDDRFGKNIIQFLKSVPKCTADSLLQLQNLPAGPECSGKNRKTGSGGLFHRLF